MKRAVEGPTQEGPGEPKGPRRDQREDRRGPRGPPFRGPPGGGRGPGAGPGPGLIPFADLPDEPDILMEVPLAKRFGSQIIGPGGQTAAAIRREARVQVHVRRQVIEGDRQIVEVKGTYAQCLDGVKIIRSIIQENEPGAEVEPSKTIFIHLEVAPEMVAPILGAKGATAKSILEKTGAQIKIGDINPEVGLQTVTVVGQYEKAKEAYKTVRTIISRFNPSRVKGPPPMMRAGRGGPPPPFLDGPPPPFMDGPPPPFMDDFRGPGPGRDFNGGPGGPGGPRPMGPMRAARSDRMDRPLHREEAPRGGFGAESEPLLPAYRGPSVLSQPSGALSHGHGQHGHHHQGEAPAPYLVLQPDGTYKPGVALATQPAASGLNQGQANSSAASSLLSQLGGGSGGSQPQASSNLGSALMSLLQQQQQPSGGQSGGGGLSVAAQLAALLTAAVAAGGSTASATLPAGGTAHTAGTVTSQVPAGAYGQAPQQYQQYQKPAESQPVTSQAPQQYQQYTSAYSNITPGYQYPAPTGTAATAYGTVGQTGAGAYHGTTPGTTGGNPAATGYGVTAYGTAATGSGNAVGAGAGAGQYSSSAPPTSAASYGTSPATTAYGTTGYSSASFPSSTTGATGQYDYSSAAGAYQAYYAAQGSNSTQQQPGQR